jgi:uncharacterized membrane protein YvbJ
MVYCTKCGTNNPNDANNCTNCGAPLYKENPRLYTHYQYTYHHEDHPVGSGIGLLIAGLFIILIGVSALFGWGIWQYIWPLIILAIGVWIITLGLRRNRRYKQGSPQ